ncbi:MAG: hypothetical protein MI922_11985 [Bacteroidales bacterium]|nr:hypothetical protein [Bacteroidales bacterium]
MKSLLNITLVGLLTGTLLLSSCKPDGNKNKGGLDVPTDSFNIESIALDPQIIDDIVQVSNPVEMAALIKSIEVGFSRKYLANIDQVDKYATSYHQAINLGIFGADLGYLNMYNQTNAVLDYIAAIKTLADGIRVGHYFDFVTLKRLAQNNENLDSLMYISVHNFNQVDKFLREDNRSNLSALMVTGVWIEGLYLATQVYKEKAHPDLKERIGEQKIVMGNLMLILENYKHDKQFASLIEQLAELKEMYSSVEITITKGDPESKVVDGVLTFIQNDISVVVMDDELLLDIIAKTEEIRNNIINI